MMLGSKALPIVPWKIHIKPYFYLLSDIIESSGKVVEIMSFRANDCQQISLLDSLSGLTTREQKALENSWAKVFAEEIFPKIDEERISVLYSNKASRPNTPVNVIIGALIIKELFDLSDDEMVENLMLDPRYQYALHTTSFTEQ